MNGNSENKNNNNPSPSPLNSEISEKNITLTKEEIDKKKIEEINNKEYLIEHYVEDPEIVKEYKDLFQPIKKRLKYTFYYNVAVCAISVYYAKNLEFFLSKYFPKMKKGLMNLVLFSSFHAIAFSAILIGGNFAILGINPRKFMDKYREIDDKIMSTDPYKDLTLRGFIDGVSEGFNKQAEKMQDTKPKNSLEKKDNDDIKIDQGNNDIKI